MIHLRKNLCGYLQYSCVGIKQIPVLQPPVCDNKNYDITSDSRDFDNNFLNLPANFQSVVQNVPFVQLGRQALWDDQKCVTDYTPLQGNQIDAFSYLQNNSAYIATYGDFKNALQCYSNNDTQWPGILLPLAQLSAFAVTPLQAVPTANLASAEPPVSTARGVASGCIGFYTSARTTGSYEINFSVTGGQLYVATDNTGEPIAIQVGALTNQVCQGSQDVINIQVYIIAGLDLVTGTWKGVLDWKSPNYDFYPSTPTRWIKQKQIATIKYVNRQLVDVIQSQCSPIDLRDWVSQESLPSSDGNYVFLYRGNSAQKEWVEVKDC